MALLQLLCETKGAAVSSNAGFYADHSFSVLHFATRENKLEFLSYLLQQEGASANATISDSSVSLIHMATTLECLKILLDAGADINEKTGRTGSTALMLAVRDYREESVKLLLSRGADVNVRDKEGKTALMHACIAGCSTIALYIIKNSPDCELNATCDIGESAFDLAERKDMFECAIDVWALGCEPSRSKFSNKQIRSIKWTRLRVLGRFDIGEDSKTENSKKLSSEFGPTSFTDRHDSVGNNDNQDIDISSLPPPPLPRSKFGATSIGNYIYVYGGEGPRCMVPRFNPEVSMAHEYNASIGGDEHYRDFQKLDVSNIRRLSLIPRGSKKSPSSIIIDKDFSDMIGMVTVSEDRLEAHWNVVKKNDDTLYPSCIFSDAPFVRQDDFSYFEVEILCVGARGVLGIGLCDEKEKNFEMLPGWAPGSLGIHSDDACAFHANPCGIQWGRRFGSGDRVGCGIIWSTGEVFYALNGEFLGVAHRASYATSFWACVGAHDWDTRVRLNFGAKNFEFDFMAPTLQWQRATLPNDLDMPSATPLQMFNIAGSLVLLGNARSTFSRRFWVSNGGPWHTGTTTGEIPRVSSHCSWATIGNDIYVVVPERSTGASQFYFQLPVLFRLRFTVPRKTSSKRGTKTQNGIHESLLHAHWQQIFAKKEDLGLSEDEAINWTQARKQIQLGFYETSIAAIGDRLCFMSAREMMFLNLHTFESDVLPYIGTPPSLSHYSITVIGPFIQFFGGWNSKSVTNDVFILDTRSATWSKPHVFGISPRPRAHHKAIAMPVKCLKGDVLGLGETNYENISECANSLQSSETGVDSASKDDNITSNMILHMFGWNGRNALDDIEILTFQRAEKPDSLLSLLQPIERKGEAGIINFKLIDTTLGTETMFSTSAIVVAARSSRLRPFIFNSPSSTIEFSSEKYPLRLFMIFLTYLHDNVANFDVDRDETRLLFHLFEEYAPEHSRRVAESLVLTRVNIPSRMAVDMEWAFAQEEMKDVRFHFRSANGDSTRPSLAAHKCILINRSTYFKSLLVGAMSESYKGEIEVNDCDFLPFLSVIRFLYTHTLDLLQASGCIIDIFTLACKFDIPELRKQVESILAYNISVENAVSIILLANSHQSDTLKKSCAAFIASNMREISKTEDFKENEKLVSSLVNSETAPSQLWQ